MTKEILNIDRATAVEYLQIIKKAYPWVDVNDDELHISAKKGHPMLITTYSEQRQRFALIGETTIVDRLSLLLDA